MGFFLGIDGGGSKTSCVVGDEVNVLGNGSAGPSNIVRVGEARAKEALHDAIREACRSANITPPQIARACLGMAGGGRAETRDAVHRVAAELITGEIEVLTDIVIALRAAFHGKPGVVVISGTGSIAYGRNSQGQTARAGGWGPAISDEGSGHWIGRAAVASCLRSGDEGHSTVLLDGVLEAWGLASSDQLVLAANASPAPDFAALAPVILSAAESNDEAARRVLIQAGAELAELAKIVIGRLFAQPDAVNVAMYGGVFANCPQVCGSFYNSLCAAYPQATVASEPDKPVMGALDLAREMGR